MSNPPVSLSSHQPLKVIDVAVGVIYYKEQYLLGFRNKTQHQGNRYEFVGGKIESTETALQALTREIAEEIGIDVTSNSAVRVGRLRHDYGDKQVCLQVFKIQLTAEQYQLQRHCVQGLEKQALTWVSQEDLLGNKYRLPAANQTILSWLQLSSVVAITHPLDFFKPVYKDDNKPLQAAWLDYHLRRIAPDGWTYIRLKSEALTDHQRIATEANITLQLLSRRADIRGIVPYKLRFALSDGLEDKPLDKVTMSAYHLTQNELIRWYTEYNNDCSNPQRIKQGVAEVDYYLLQDLLTSSDYSTIPLIISCHDQQSINAANQLAALRIEKSLAPVIAVFLSPVLATKTHPHSQPLGWEKWSDLAQYSEVPVIALGGLKRSELDLATQHGAAAIAGIRNFLNNG